MNKDNFENPTEFCPHRWLRNTNKMNSAHPFAVTQFGFGPRSCLGKHMALTEAYLLIIKVSILIIFFICQCIHTVKAMIFLAQF